MKRQCSQEHFGSSQRQIHRHATLNDQIKTHQLPKNFAENLLNLELDIESESTINISTITSLIQLYMQAIEFYELQKNDRYQIFQQKLNKLFSNPKVASILSQNCSTQQSQSLSPQNPTYQRQQAKTLRLHQINQQAVLEATTSPQSAKIMLKNVSEIKTQISTDVRFQSDQILQRIGKMKTRRLKKQYTLNCVKSNQNNFLLMEQDNEEKKMAPPPAPAGIQSISETQSDEDTGELNKKESDEIKQKQITLLKQNCIDLTKLIQNCKHWNKKYEQKSNLHFRQNSHFMQLGQTNNLIQLVQTKEQTESNNKKRVSLYANKKKHEMTVCQEENNELAVQIQEISQKFAPQIKTLKDKISQNPQSALFFQKILTKIEQEQKNEIDKLKPNVK